MPSPARTSVTRAALVAGAALTVLWSVAAAAAGIDTCKYLVVADLANDTVALAQQLREQAGKRGFTVVASGDDVPAAESFGVCTVVGSWLGSVEMGQLSVRVINDADGMVLASADVSASNRLGFEPMLRSAARKAYDQMGYAGFRPQALDERLSRLYPARPTYDVSPAWLAAWKPGHPFEGVWTDAEGGYRLAIVPSPSGLPGTHIGVVLESGTPLWRRGEIKIEFTGTASPGNGPVAATFYLLNKQPHPATVVVTAARELEATLSTPAGRRVVRLTRAVD